MSGQGVKDIFKKGWHPEKEGTTFKGQIKSLVGRGDKNEPKESYRPAAPLSSLRDPSSFGPPPKHVNVGGERYLPPPQSQGQTQPPAYQRVGDSPNPSEDSREVGSNPSPPRPFRSDTTGLSTSNLPPPPGRRDAAGGRVLPPPSYSAATSPGPPKLPPRLPPRANTPSASVTPELPERKPDPEVRKPDGALLNQGAVSRLGAAGISVPGLGIGKSSTGPGGDSAQPSELPSRFAKLGVSSGARSSSDVPTQGTTLAQKQAALKTAAAFRQDPSSVSLSDAKSAASTLNNFRQRHGDQVAAGLRTANSLSERFGHTSKSPAAESQTGTSGILGMASAAGGLALGKKPAPPPPPKKPELGAQGAGRAGDEPPPIPLLTKPRA